MVEASFLASFLGGLLSLLSPCSALLLPAFFAYAFQSRGELDASLRMRHRLVSLLFFGRDEVLVDG